MPALHTATSGKLDRPDARPPRRHDIYVVDDDAWYHSTMVSSRQTLAAAEIAKTAGQTHGLDTPLERISPDALASAERYATSRRCELSPIGRRAVTGLAAARLEGRGASSCHESVRTGRMEQASMLSSPSGP